MTKPSRITLICDNHPAEYARLTAQTDAATLRGWLDAAKEQRTMTPNKTHTHFTGRKRELAEVQQQLDSQPLVAIIGLGGMGKTTLALETIAALQAKTPNPFEAVVWTSSKVEQFMSESVQVVSPTAQADSLDSLIDQIARQALPNGASLLPAQQRAAVRDWLAAHPTLIVLDNFESVKEPLASQLLQALHDLLGQSKVLITSRHRVRYEQVSQIDLRGLRQRSGVAFLRQEAGQRNLREVVEARDEALGRIHKACGGQPLAMRLVVGQLGRLSLRRVLGYLEQPQSHADTYDLYRFIYQTSWDILSHEARELLVAIGTQPPDVPVFDDDLEAIMTEEDDLSPAEFNAAIDALIHCSLIEVEGGLDKQYRLHPLTYQFIKSDITREWV